MAPIRPATVLSILLFIAFGCLLVSVLSVPIVKGIPLATNNDVKFGVFGYCEGQTNNCTGIKLGYNIDSLSSPKDFSLPSKARLTLTNLLVIHPVACLLVLIQLVLTIASHFYTPGHSPSYLLSLVFYSIFTCVVAILAFLVDILLFVPHLAAGGYIVVGAPICLAIVVVGICATRRRVVAKQDRKRRIAESAPSNNLTHLGETNAESSFGVTGAGRGESNNFKSPPDGDKLPEFATFELTKQGTDDVLADENGDRVPLNPQHQSPPPGMPMRNEQIDSGQRGYGQGNMFTGGSSNYQTNMGPRNGLNQRQGPLPPSHRLPLNHPNNLYGSALGQGGNVPPYGPPRISPSPNGQRGMPVVPYRSGPSPSPQSGYGGTRGPGVMPSQQEYGPGEFGRGPGGPAFGGGFGAPLNPPPEGNNYIGPPPRGASPGLYGSGPRRGPSPQQISGGYYPDSQPQTMAYQDSRGYPQTDRGRSGQTGQTGQQQLGVIEPPSGDDRIGQPVREAFDTTEISPINETAELPDDRGRRDTTISLYGADNGNSYIPPRAQWQKTETQVDPIELAGDAVATARDLPEPATSQVIAELPADNNNLASAQPINMNLPQASDNYYEDIDPRFANEQGNQTTLANNNSADAGVMPPSLVAGYGARTGSSPPPQSTSPARFNRPPFAPQGNINRDPNYAPGPSNRTIQPNNGGYGGIRPPSGYPYAEPPGGQPSPALSNMSEQTTFTSISQRPINPRWQAGGPQGPPQGRGPQRTVPEFLVGNPDFELPTLTQGRRGGGGRMPGGIPPGLGQDRGGRYPPPPPNMGR